MNKLYKFNENDKMNNNKNDDNKFRNKKSGKKKPNLNWQKPNFLMTLAMLVVLFIILSRLGDKFVKSEKEISYTQMINKVKSGLITNADFSEKDVLLTDKNGYKFKTTIPYRDPELVKNFVDSGVNVSSKKPSLLFAIFVNWFPTILLILFFIFWFRSVRGDGSKAFSFGKSRAKLFINGKTRITFKDVAGVEEAKEELEEIVDFLKEPKKFQKLGGRIPRGVLLLGRPGTGKTLLAKAVAGEAGVPFFSMSGSDFVEMFVGVGASRVRDLFKQAKENSPCIAFIDEIDAVGRHRGTGIGGGHDEREQTLNQLLVEMDGFEKNSSVIIIAATNRPDVLDPALLRPGRFDRQVVVDLPDIKGREAILKVHSKELPVSENVKMSLIARSTPGFSGADLANLCNEAALLAARQNKSKIEMSDFEEAKDKVTMGKERKSQVISDREKHNTAVHEIGHVLCSIFQDLTESLHKVTIIPRGFSAGATHFLQSDKRNYSKKYLGQKIVELLGGRTAEEIIFGELTTGAANDIERVSDLARNMVCKWGMSNVLGPMTIAKDDGNVFLGKEIASHNIQSQETAKLVDEEIRAIVKLAHKKAYDILIAHKELLKVLSDELLLKETLGVDEIFEVILKYSSEDEIELVKMKYEKAQEMKIDIIEEDESQNNNINIVEEEIEEQNKDNEIENKEEIMDDNDKYEEKEK